MVITPWGDASRLREKKARPGGASPSEATQRSQRERLFAAMVATVSEKGYDATSVADLTDLSGVSRSSFYNHFEDKQACFLAAITALTRPAVRQAEEEGLGGGPAQAKKAFVALIKRIVAQPAAAKMCFVEIYAAGAPAVEILDEATNGFEELFTKMFDQVPERQGMPPELVRGIIGGVQKVIHKRLLRGEEAELVKLAPELWEWVLAVPPPPGPLRPARRRTVKPIPFADRQGPASASERLLRAMAAVVSEKGYRDAKVGEIVERASTSQRTFYENFASKEDAIVAALDSGSAQMLAAALPAFRRAPDWQHAVHATQEAMLRFAAEEPEYGRLGAVEMYGAGKRALEQREMITEGMEGLLEPGYQLAPKAPPIAAEAIGGALYALLYDFVTAKKPECLLELVPAFVYVTLVPFLGAEEAYEVAMS